MDNRVEQWINWIQYDEIIQGDSRGPQRLLGRHACGKGMIYILYRPEAKRAWLIREGKDEYPMNLIEDKGLFGVYLSDQDKNSYQYKIEYSSNDVITIYDPYTFGSEFGDLDKYLFAEGTHYEIYNKLGAHLKTIDGISGTLFTVWAPNAKSISVVGDFNMWDDRLHPMILLDSSGVYELFIPGVSAGAIYKYRIKSRTGDTVLKSDPYANYAELRPNNASVVVDLSLFEWSDQDWVKKQMGITRNERRRLPMAIYECHLGSWKKVDESEDGFYSYREMASMLGKYLVDMQYTHVELMGIAEYPFDGSWGYQVTGYYAPTSRYGSPDDFKYFVNHMHSLGIEVILDWVPAHFPKDKHGLGRFDGTPLYEHPDPRRGEHPDWGTYIFDYSRNEVSNFLIANALFWSKEYHIDALRVDAVASMLYLDYGKQDGNWLPNPDGSNDNKDAIRLFQHLNGIIGEQAPGLYMIAEESTSWAGVTAPVDVDGLGFLYKWNMGWMNDFLEYMKMDPLFRAGNHHKLCFSMMYAYSENFIQVLSHDEVVHGKASMLNKMPGEMENKFENLKAAYGFMYGHPGKKLLFMGQEFGQEREWSEARALDWNLLELPEHKMLQTYIKMLNTIYNKYDALYYNDCDSIGFEWMSCDDSEHSTVAFVRRGSTTKKQLLFLCNFTPITQKGYQIGVPCNGRYTEILRSDEIRFGGVYKKKLQTYKAIKNECDGKEYSITMDVPPLSTIILSYDFKEEKA